MSGGVASKLHELGRVAAERLLVPDEVEVSREDYAELREYVVARLAVTGEDLAMEAGRLNPRSPYWGSPSLAERNKMAAIRWCFDGGNIARIVERADLIGGPIMICRDGTRITL